MTDLLRPVARHIFQTIGEADSVSRYAQDAGPLWIDMGLVRTAPHFVTWATIGMSKFHTGYSVNGQPLRVELLAAAPPGEEVLGDALSSCAFNVGSGDYGIGPDTVFPGVIRAYNPLVNMSDLMFVPPFMWERSPENFVTDAGEIVTWLMAVPVSAAEFELARAEGIAVLQSALEAESVDVLNLDRPSVQAAAKFTDVNFWPQD